MTGLPPLALVGLVFAALVAVSEVLAWYTLNPLLMPLMLFRAEPPVPQVPDPSRLRGMDGVGEVAVWRWQPEARALLFRRRQGFGRRRAGLWGFVRVLPGGRTELRWAPFPLLLYPVLPLILWPLFLLDKGAPPEPLPFVVALGFAVTFVGGLSYLQARSFLRTRLLDELRGQIEAHLR